MYSFRHRSISAALAVVGRLAGRVVGASRRTGRVVGAALLLAGSAFWALRRAAGGMTPTNATHNAAAAQRVFL